MAKARYKITLILSIGDRKGTESYITPSADDSVMTGLLRNLLLARMNLLSNRVTVKGVRVAQIANAADLPVKRASKFHRPGLRYPFLIPDKDGTGGSSMVIPVGGAQTDDVEWKPDVTGTAAIVRLSYGEGRATQRYYFGWPDNGLDGLAPMAIVTSAMLPFWNAWVTRIRTDGWCIQARSYSGNFREVPILKWIASGATPALVGVEIASADAPVIEQRSIVSIKNTRRRGTDKMSYNGPYEVDSVVAGGSAANTKVFLMSTEGGDPTTIKRKGTLQPVGKTFVPIDWLEVVEGGTHKRGNSAGSQRGNRRKRVSLDF